MPKLSELIDVKINTETVCIQGVDIPIMFAMESFEYVKQAYGKPYPVFEKDLNNMLGNKRGNVSVRVGQKEMKIMYCLVFAMVKTGGTDCTLQEIRGGIPLGDLKEVFQKVLDVFQAQEFQQKDINRMRQSKSKKS